MTGETNLKELIKNMTPVLNKGEYVFVSQSNARVIPVTDVIGVFKEKEGTTLVLERTKADELRFNYDYIASWITLEVHSSLDAVGLTAAFSTELAKNGISCNVIAGYYHDHIFVARCDAERTIEVLRQRAKR